ncbi:MAG: hypothetical protein IJL78_01525 [Lachnospiraceae bacterium]|nr:hypothetical protein [Lachnospiraceae bacterium]
MKHIHAPSRNRHSVRRHILILLTAILITMLLSGCQLVLPAFYYSKEVLITFRQKDVSPDGEYEVVVYDKGVPLTYHTVRVQLLHNGEVLETFDDDLYDNGGYGEIETVWYPHGADVLLSGKEQREPSHHGLPFDTGSYTGMNTAEEAADVLKARYGEDTAFILEDGSWFVFRVGDVPFRVKNDVILTDNYEDTKILMERTEEYFENTEYPHEFRWKESGLSVSKAPYLIPYITLPMYPEEYPIPNSDDYRAAMIREWLYESGGLVDMTKMKQEDIDWFFSYFWLYQGTVNRHTESGERLVNFREYYGNSGFNFRDLSNWGMLTYAVRSIFGLSTPGFGSI